VNPPAVSASSTRAKSIGSVQPNCSASKDAGDALAVDPVLDDQHAGVASRQRGQHGFQGRGSGAAQQDRGPVFFAAAVDFEQVLADPPLQLKVFRLAVAEIGADGGLAHALAQADRSGI
jgi:hypothetical protein